MKTYIRFKQHKNRHQNIKQREPHQKYRIGAFGIIKSLGIKYIGQYQF